MIDLAQECPGFKTGKKCFRFVISHTAPSLNTWYKGGMSVTWRRNKDKTLWRKLVKEAVEQFKIEEIDSGLFPIDVKVISQFKDKRRRDSDNWITAAKLIIDGLKDCGIIPDDDTRYIRSVRTEVRTGQDEQKTIVELEVCNV